MKSIGGYFELEKYTNKEYHKKLIALNTARNAFEYILKARKINKIYIPYYTCYVMLEPIKKLDIEFEFYKINEKLLPIIDFEIGDREAILINNYYGLTGKRNKELRKVKNVILDNAQAYYEKPFKNIDTIYSCRKFFGVADGAYLSTANLLEEDFCEDISADRYHYILTRFEVGAESGYVKFQKNEESLCNQPIKKMSKITKNFLQSFDYKKIKKIREDNYNYLHNKLKEYNELKIDLNGVDGPMVYPFFYKNKNLKEKLIKNKIYIATYWKEVLEKVETESIEAKLVKYLIPLPIDQRYCKKAMKKIVDIILEEIE